VRPLTVVAQARAKKGSEKFLEDALRRVARESQREEGCWMYVVHRDAGDPAFFMTVERWRSQSDIDRHMASSHIGELLRRIPEWVAGAPTITVLEALVDGLPEKGFPN